MPQKTIKVAISGAAGQIGYALLFRVASGQMFGPDTQVELRLLELEAALPALAGVVMELEDGAFPLLRKIECTSSVEKAVEGVNWAVLVGAVPRKQGMERKDLLKINGSIFGPIGKALNEHAAADVQVLVVGNPCNTNCLITMNNAPSIPRHRFYAMTALDELRARSQLAIRANVPVSAIKNMVIWGNHSATQFPDFYHAQINGKSVMDVIKDEHWLQHDFMTTVQQRGAAVIKARGASSAASAANAAITSVHNVVHGVQAGEWFSLALCSEGQYGVDKGLIFSYPCVLKQGAVSVVEGVNHVNAFAKEKFNLTLNELREERDAVKELGLI